MDKINFKNIKKPLEIFKLTRLRKNILYYILYNGA